MTRGACYRVARPGLGDPKRHRVFVVVSRQVVIDSRHSTVICAPVYSTRLGLSTEVEVGVDEGLRHESSVHCDALVSLSKTVLTDFVGHLGSARLAELDRALAAALAIDPANLGHGG